MASDDSNLDPINSVSPSPSLPWKDRILIPTLLAGLAGGAVGLVSKHRNVHGLSKISTAYASNFAIVTGCYCAGKSKNYMASQGEPSHKTVSWSDVAQSYWLHLLNPWMIVKLSNVQSIIGAREFVRVNRNGKPDDLLNSVIGGFGSGAILGRLQGGQMGAARYSVIFAAVGTSVDYATVTIMPATAAMLSKFVAEKKESWLRLPEWSPIRVLDEEALAEKRAREQQIFRKVHNLNKDE